VQDRDDVTTVSKPFAHRLHAMITSELISHREYAAWADSLIMQLDRPPTWLLDFTLTTDSSEAAKLLLASLFSDPPYVGLGWDIWAEDCIASQKAQRKQVELKHRDVINSVRAAHRMLLALRPPPYRSPGIAGEGKTASNPRNYRTFVAAENPLVLRV
jgi:hypothetical protein